MSAGNTRFPTYTEMVCDSLKRQIGGERRSVSFCNALGTGVAAVLDPTDSRVLEVVPFERPADDPRPSLAELRAAVMPIRVQL